MGMFHSATDYEHEKEREQQTTLIMNLFERWRLTYKQQAIMLGTSPRTATSINNYKKGKTYLPQNRDTQDRITHLLAIHKYLRRVYPLNKELAYRWITTANSDFNNESPFEIISKEGLMGLVRVRQYLELNQ